MINNVFASDGITNVALSSSLQGMSGGAFLQGLLSALISLGLIAGAVFFIFNLIMGGIQWINSAGDKANLETARKRVSNALIGLVVLFSVFAITSLLENFLGTDILQFDLGALQIGGGTGGSTNTNSNGGGITRPPQTGVQQE